MERQTSTIEIEDEYDNPLRKSPDADAPAHGAPARSVPDAEVDEGEKTGAKDEEEAPQQTQQKSCASSLANMWPTQREALEKWLALSDNQKLLMVVLVFQGSRRRARA